MKESNIQIDAKAWEGLTAAEILEKANASFGARLLFASSLGKEDQVLTELIAKAKLPVKIITLDTGRLFPETYDLIEETERLYGTKIQALSPDTAELQRLVEEHGVNLFRKSVPLRKECCRVRKIEPLKKALSQVDAWIVGLRSGQSETRASIPAIAWDESFGIWKIAPLASWSEADVDAYAAANAVPVSALHAKGYPSIGCAPCTSPVEPGEHPRAGRWRWEAGEKRECGLHFSNGKLVRKST